MKRRDWSVLTRQKILRTLRQNRSLLDQHAVDRIALFGSFAANAQTEKSDIDLLVEFRRPTYGNFLGLARNLESLFGRRVEILTPEGLDSIRVPAIANRIRKSRSMSRRADEDLVGDILGSSTPSYRNWKTRWGNRQPIVRTGDRPPSLQRFQTTMDDVSIAEAHDRLAGIAGKDIEGCRTG